MHLVIKNKTYKLKEFNAERRALFVQNILSNYGEGSFEQKMLDIQKIVLEKHNVKISLDRIKKDYFKEFDKLIYATVWDFLKDEDKKEIGIVVNLEINPDEKVKFIEFYSDKVKKLVGSISADGVAVDPITIFTFVAKHLGRSVEEIKEMDEVLLLTVVKEVSQMIKEERAESVNLNALGTALAQGNKSAKSQVGKINNDAKRTRDTKRINPESIKEENNFSLDQMRRMANGGA